MRSDDKTIFRELYILVFIQPDAKIINIVGSLFHRVLLFLQSDVMERNGKKGISLKLEEFVFRFFYSRVQFLFQFHSYRYVKVQGITGITVIQGCKDTRYATDK